MPAESPTVKIPTSASFFKALPWLIAMFALALVSWKFWAYFLGLFMSPENAQFSSIGVSTMGAYVLCMIALAGNWPLGGIQGRWARGIAAVVVAKILAALLFIIPVVFFDVNMVVWAFPIIATSWFVFSVTSFVGGDAHLKDIPPVRRMLLNLLISIGFTLVLIRTIYIFPAQWFPFLQATAMTGGLAYFFRRVKQPAFSFLAWALLLTLMFVLLAGASLFNHFTLNVGATPALTWDHGQSFPAWAWSFGDGGTAKFNLFFAFACGLNLSVFGCTQCWPFCRIRQPWGTPVATIAMICWCVVAAMIFGHLFETVFAPGEGALFNAQIMAWHTVFWGFAWVYAFGVGQTPYLWAGQKTPGTWDDVD